METTLKIKGEMNLPAEISKLVQVCANCFRSSFHAPYVSKLH